MNPNDEIMERFSRLMEDFQSVKLINAYRGNMHEGFATCGANAYRIDRILSVHELIQELVDECRLHLKPRDARF